MWYCVWNGEQICTCVTRKSARYIARTLNGVLRRLQRQPWVDTNSIIAQLANYLSQAVLPNNGFQPVMLEGLVNVPPVANA